MGDEVINTFDKQEQVIDPINNLLGENKLSDITDFLKGKELDVDSYTVQFNTTKKRIDDLNLELLSISKKLNSNLDSFTDEERMTINQLLEKFKTMKKMFSVSILTPEKFAEKLKKYNPIDLGSINPRSSWEDVTLSTEQLMQLKPEKILAISSNGIVYIKVTYDGKPTILRYNRDKVSDEVALYNNFVLPEGFSNDDLKRLIISVERQGGFQDVEIQDSRSASNIGMVASGIGAGLLPGAGIAGVGAASSTLLGGSTGLAGAIGAFTPPGWAASAIAGTSVVIGGVVAAATDLDYTTSDYFQDFGGEMSKLSSLIGKTNYINN